MLQDAYTYLSSVAERHTDDIITTAFENWPPLYKEFALARPVASLPLSSDKIEVVLRGSSDRARWKQQAIAIPEIAQHTIELRGGGCSQRLARSVGRKYRPLALWSRLKRQR